MTPNTPRRADAKGMLTLRVRRVLSAAGGWLVRALCSVGQYPLGLSAAAWRGPGWQLAALDDDPGAVERRDPACLCGHRLSEHGDAEPFAYAVTADAEGARVASVAAAVRLRGEAGAEYPVVFLSDSNSRPPRTAGPGVWAEWAERAERLPAAPRGVVPGSPLHAMLAGRQPTVQDGTDETPADRAARHAAVNDGLRALGITVHPAAEQPEAARQVPTYAVELPASALAEVAQLARQQLSMADRTDTVQLPVQRPATPTEQPTGHWSDCATHNEPALPAGPCDCGGDAPTPTGPCSCSPTDTTRPPGQHPVACPIGYADLAATRGI